jgi:dCTP deaminase
MQQGILSGPEIVKRIEEGSIEVDPFVEAHVNPNSLDLTLGTRLAVYDRVVEARLSTGDQLPGSMFRTRQGFDTFGGHPRHGAYLDMSREEGVVHFDIGERGFLLLPGIMYLAHTAERVCAKKDVPVLDGKSSIGRLGIKVHLTAGYGDIGFDGQYTLEVEVTHPVLVFAGVRFCQIRFHTVCGELDSYQSHKSNYVGELARGPVPSRAWKMFTR